MDVMRCSLLGSEYSVRLDSCCVMLDRSWESVDARVECVSLDGMARIRSAAVIAVEVSVDRVARLAAGV